MALHAYKHGSWLDAGHRIRTRRSRVTQCLDRRIADKQILCPRSYRNGRGPPATSTTHKATRHYPTANARVKLKRLYPQCLELTAAELVSS